MSATQERKRFRRRTWNITKPHLPKYSSVPELQLLPQGRPQFHCRRCGFTNTLIPLCLWCTWSSQEAEREFELSMPRARRASAPPRVFFNNGSYPTHVRTHDRKSPSASPSGMSWGRRNPFSKLNTRSFPHRVDSPHMSETHIGVVHEEAQKEVRWVQQETETEQADRFDVAKVPKLLPPQVSSTEIAQEGLGLPIDLHSPGATHTMIDLHDPLGPPSSPPLSVERCKSEPMKTLKSSRRLLFIDLHGSRAPSNNDDHHSQYNSPDHNSPDHKDTNLSSPVSPGPPQHFRTLRRQKAVNALMPASTPEPISISLSLRSTPSKRNMKPPSRPNSTTRLSKTQSHTHSASTESSVLTTPPITPIRLPPTSSPTAESTDSPSPVRLGHPSRPYYTAIRKGGISPPPSRPSSSILPSPPVSTRPQSYQPPSSFHFGTSLGGADATSATTRHLSMSSLFAASSTSSSRPGTFSAFSVMDIDSDNLNGDDSSVGHEDLPIRPPSPIPSRLSFSLPRVALKASAKSSSSGHSKSQSQSHSSARSKARGSGIGFSMSGETELRMALAAGAASAGAVGDGFRYRETVVPDSSAPRELGGDADVFGRGRTMNLRESSRKGQRSDSFMGRVRKLRKGLKEMLLMNSSSPTTRTTTTS